MNCIKLDFVVKTLCMGLFEPHHSNLQDTKGQSIAQWHKACSSSFTPRFVEGTLVIGQQATGVNAFLGYAATLFKQILCCKDSSDVYDDVKICEVCSALSL